MSCAGDSRGQPWRAAWSTVSAEPSAPGRSGELRQRWSWPAVEGWLKRGCCRGPGPGRLIWRRRGRCQPSACWERGRLLAAPSLQWDLHRCRDAGRDQLRGAAQRVRPACACEERGSASQGLQPMQSLRCCAASATPVPAWSAGPNPELAQLRVKTPCSCASKTAHSGTSATPKCVRYCRLNVQPAKYALMVRCMIYSHGMLSMCLLCS